MRVVLLSEYGICAVEAGAFESSFPAEGLDWHQGELGLELLDCGASKVFAVADHQVAHIYLNDRSLEGRARRLAARGGCRDGARRAEKTAWDMEHPRAGDLIAVAEERAWFTYYYWLEEARAPDFARCVDIHRKPGYDPVELFLDPATALMKWKILWRLLQKKLGFRMLMDVIPLDASLVKGSHGGASSGGRPVLICERAEAPLPPQMDSTEVFGLLKKQVTG